VWATTTTCASTALCNSGAVRCDDPVCSTGQFRCVDANNLDGGPNLVTCNVGRTGWAPVMTCATSTLCDPGGGVCKPPLCDASNYHCNGSTLQACGPGRDQWVNSNQCLSPANCDPGPPGRCTPGPCNAGDYRCNGAL